VQRESDEPEPVDEFDRIVSGWQRERSVPAWPEDDPAGTHRPGGSPAEPPAAEDDHFVPPDPPPLPKMGPPAMVGLTLLGLGLVLVAAPSWIGVSGVYGLPLGLLTLASGLGWLVLRLWPDPPTREGGDDDGAVL